MPPPRIHSKPAEASGRGRVWRAGLVLALAVAAAYLTSFRGVMVFDDLHSIVENPTIRDLSRLDLVLVAPAEGGTTAGRPVVNLTLALNHAVGGLNPWGYHAFNLGIHILAGLLLFGLVRRTLGALRSRSPLAGDVLESPASGLLHGDPDLLALAIAALWALHPLQTESVTYIVQRTESLAGLFFLFTLYCFIRGVGRVSLLRQGFAGHADPPQSGTRQVEDLPYLSRRSHLWFTASVVSCLLAVGTKETAAAAPLVVLLYDRTFVAGSWREAWQQRWRIHFALFASWLLLAALILVAEGRGGTAGFGTTIAWWEYALTQCGAIVHYLRLSFWPHPLVFDYGTPVIRSLAPVAWQAGVLLVLLAATVWALVKKPMLGFLGTWFFLILAPSSSIVPVATQTMAEHRMYLPLAAVVVLPVIAAHALAGRRAVVGLLVLSLAAGVLTARRNLVYRSELALWSDTVAHRPENARAHTNLGIALTEAGRAAEAVASFEESLRLEPDNAVTHLNLCETLTRLNRAAEAVPHGEAAVRLEPRSANARVNLANALASLGRISEAVPHFEEALRLEPDAADIPDRLAAAYHGLGNEAASRRDFAGAIARYRQALRLVPTFMPARNNLANALLVSGQVGEAIVEYQEVLRQNPGERGAQENLALALEMQRSRRQ